MGVHEDNSITIIDGNINGPNENSIQEFANIPDWRQRDYTYEQWHNKMNFTFCNPQLENLVKSSYFAICYNLGFLRPDNMGEYGII